nr:helix-turn-helix transcriptional regulator [Clostridia bacterium]
MIVKLDITAIKKLMVEQRMTGVALAKLTGISRQNISTILRRGTCSSKNVGLLADALGVEIEEIWKED